MKPTDPTNGYRSASAQRNIVWTVLFSIFLIVTWNACAQPLAVPDDAPPPPDPPTRDAKLSTLTVTDGSLQPAFSSDVAYYTLDVVASTARVTVTAAAQDPGDSVSIDNQTTTNLLVPLNEAGGHSTISIVVTTPNGNRNTYIVKVMRDAFGSNNRLQSLSVSPGPLAPPFDPSTTSYTVNVADTVDRIMVAAQAQDAEAAVRIATEKTTTRSVPLGPAGGPTVVSIEVTAPNNTKKVVTVRVNRASPRYQESSIGSCGVGGAAMLANTCNGEITTTPAACYYDCSTDDNGGAGEAVRNVCQSLGGSWSGYFGYWDSRCTLPNIHIVAPK